MEEDPTCYIVRVLNSTSFSGMGQTEIRPFARRQSSKSGSRQRPAEMFWVAELVAANVPRPSATAVASDGWLPRHPPTNTKVNHVSIHARSAMCLCQIPRCRVWEVSRRRRQQTQTSPFLPLSLFTVHNSPRDTMRGPQKQLLSFLGLRLNA